MIHFTLVLYIVSFCSYFKFWILIFTSSFDGRCFRHTSADAFSGFADVAVVVVSSESNVSLVSISCSFGIVFVCRQRQNLFSLFSASVYDTSSIFALSAIGSWYTLFVNNIGLVMKIYWKTSIYSNRKVARHDRLHAASHVNRSSWFFLWMQRASECATHRASNKKTKKIGSKLSPPVSTTHQMNEIRINEVLCEFICKIDVYFAKSKWANTNTS